MKQPVLRGPGNRCPLWSTTACYGWTPTARGPAVPAWATLQVCLRAGQVSDSISEMDLGPVLSSEWPPGCVL